MKPVNFLGKAKVHTYPRTHVCCRKVQLIYVLNVLLTTEIWTWWSLQFTFCGHCLTSIIMQVAAHIEYASQTSMWNRLLACFVIKCCKWIWNHNTLLLPQVVSSVVDQDSYVGFVGVQGHKSPSSSPKPPSKASKLPKPEVPPPAPSMKIRPRVSSLSNQNTSFKNSSGIRPPKPDLPPPPFHPDGNVLKENGPPRTSPLKHTKPELNAHRPQSRSPSPKVCNLFVREFCVFLVLKSKGSE